ncbi:hypothetical protein Q8F55_001903 [Vanrija albida]|uniref:alpha-1,2-Mannosidase n=1 Tax=Vanrija albida TaxID=181172 RepID=A0ABR3Q8J6_9TREE
MASKYDVEAGTLANGSRSVRRQLSGRRGRLLLGALVIGGVILYLNGPGASSPPHGHGTVVVPDTDGKLGGGDIWDSPTPEEDSAPTPAPGKSDARPLGEHYIVDKYGDHFFPHHTREIAPMHPRKTDLMDPALLFPEVDDAWLKPPAANAFPDERLREIVSEEQAETSPVKGLELPADAFASTWKGPERWDAPRGRIQDMQWAGFKKARSGWENDAQKKLREERRAAVKRGFVYAWQAYKDKAWGHDEVRPFSESTKDPFNGWGASIIDTLDTILIMGLKEEYDLCRPHINQLNFHWVGGRDWKRSYVAPESETDHNGKPWSVPRDPATGMPVFETGIRYLGGLLGAYDLTGDKLVLERAEELAGILARAFNTRSGLPQASRFDPGQAGGVYNLGSVSPAEVGSMSLEMTRLSQITGNRTYFDLVQRVTDFLDEHVTPRVKHHPLIPMHFVPDAKTPIEGSYSFGAMTDSYFEYLIKQYKLIGGGRLGHQYKRLYQDSIDTARRILFTDIDILDTHDLFTIGKLEGGRLKRETEHLACFAGGMLGMGAKLLDRPMDMDSALRFTATCYWLSAATKTGIQPELVQFYDKDDAKLFVNKTRDTERIVHAPAVVPDKDAREYDYKVMFRDYKGQWLFSDDQTPVSENSGRQGNKALEYYRYLNGEVPGAQRVTPYYINRPETIESVFYMYRLTGDRKWQDKGWHMFQQWMKTAKVPGGISSVQNVNADKVIYGDNMESFIFAETFKYHYLLQSEPDFMSLDDYVLNTEAHPFIATDDIKPGSQGFWTPPESEPDLGERGEGTDTQKWMRLTELDRYRTRYKHAGVGGVPPPIGRPPRPGGGRQPGGGMGGGGGDPNHRPQPPPDFKLNQF